MSKRAIQCFLRRLLLIGTVTVVFSGCGTEPKATDAVDPPADATPNASKQKTPNSTSPTHQDEPLLPASTIPAGKRHLDTDPLSRMFAPIEDRIVNERRPSDKSPFSQPCGPSRRSCNMQTSIGRCSYYFSIVVTLIDGVVGVNSLEQLQNGSLLNGWPTTENKKTLRFRTCFMSEKKRL